MGKTSIGADISAFSQFEDEKEYLYAPLTHLQLVGEPCLAKINGCEVSVLQVHLTLNQRTKTVEQAERMRIDFLQSLSSGLEWEVSFVIVFLHSECVLLHWECVCCD